MPKISATRYGIPARFLHWGMAVLIIAGLFGVELHELFPKGSVLRSALMTVHFQAGVLVLALVWLRMAIVAFNLPPPISPAPPPWQKRLARATHLAFYIVMIVSPILGIIVLQASGKSVDLFGLPMPMPVLVGEDKEFSKALREIHETIGNVMIALIVTHVVAVVWHHAVKKDNTLRRMLP